jgi:hypothetical protein
MTISRLAAQPSIRLLAAALALTAAASAHAVEPLRQHDVVLLQPGTLIEQRVAGGADAMAAYLNSGRCGHRGITQRGLGTRPAQ